MRRHRVGHFTQDGTLTSRGLELYRKCHGPEEPIISLHDLETEFKAKEPENGNKEKEAAEHDRPPECGEDEISVGKGNEHSHHPLVEE